MDELGRIFGDLVRMVPHGPIGEAEFIFDTSVLPRVPARLSLSARPYKPRIATTTAGIAQIFSRFLSNLKQRVSLVFSCSRACSMNPSASYWSYQQGRIFVKSSIDQDSVTLHQLGFAKFQKVLAIFLVTY